MKTSGEKGEKEGKREEKEEKEEKISSAARDPLWQSRRIFRRILSPVCASSSAIAKIPEQAVNVFSFSSGLNSIVFPIIASLK